MQATDNFSRVFENLRAEYTKSLPGRLAELESSYTGLKSDPGDRKLLDTFHRQAHNLTGSGASYGYADLSKAARALEQLLKEAVRSTVSMSPHDLATVGRHLDAINSSLHADTPAVGTLASASTTTTIATERQRQVAFFVGDCEDADAIGLQLSYFGYLTKLVSTKESLLAYLRDSQPDAIILAVSSVEDIEQLTPVSTLAISCETPIMFVSDKADLAMRLAAVRSGGFAYVTKPYDVASLVDQLDERIAGSTGEPYRILIVDDQPIDSALYASALDSVGMITHVVNNPALTLDAIRDFNPELVLLDMYMPGISGEELAQVLRQQSAYVSIPLVFLSAETDTRRQLDAMRVGADDFLTKPLNLEHLVASVTTRAKRYRALRSFMQRDSLTGLLNHTKSKEFLDIEIARAEREAWPLTFAMVDIDHFKNVNDTFGHPVGDRVIKSLARLLQQRLRRSDIVGRYGGEEFAVILSNTSGETAARLMDELRENFSQLAHQADTADFQITFSCGVAQFRQGSSANELANEADKALYRAKRRGRNQVILA